MQADYEYSSWHLLIEGGAGNLALLLRYMAGFRSLYLDNVLSVNITLRLTICIRQLEHICYPVFLLNTQKVILGTIQFSLKVCLSNTAP